MSEITKPTETIQLPAPSWAPAVFGLGVLGLFAGNFAADFMFPAWFYAAVGAVFVLLAFRTMVRRGQRSFYSLPREQDDARAELPVESFTAPTIDE